jgi:hypothetical protein
MNFCTVVTQIYNPLALVQTDFLEKIYESRHILREEKKKKKVRNRLFILDNEFL